MNYAHYIKATVEALNVMAMHSGEIEEARVHIKKSIESQGTLFFCGNGGSAADSQHWAAELMGVFRKKGKPMRAIALTVDSSSITSIANDSAYKYVFARQLQGLGRSNDVLFAISTSGNSESIVEAAKAGQKIGMKVIGISGKGGGDLFNHSDVKINAPGFSTEVIQHVHATIGHYLLGAVEELRDSEIDL